MSRARRGVSKGEKLGVDQTLSNHHALDRNAVNPNLTSRLRDFPLDDYRGIIKLDLHGGRVLSLASMMLGILLAVVPINSILKLRVLFTMMTNVQSYHTAVVKQK